MQRDQQLTTARILWAALQASILLYGAVLFLTGRAQLLSFPSSATPVELLALVAPSIYIVNLLLFRRRLAAARTGQEFFVAHLLFWVLNEVIVVLGFLASMQSEGGNAFFYLTNAAVALLANLRAFPSWKSSDVHN